MIFLHIVGRIKEKVNACVGFYELPVYSTIGKEIRQEVAKMILIGEKINGAIPSIQKESRRRMRT